MKVLQRNPVDLRMPRPERPSGHLKYGTVTQRHLHVAIPSTRHPGMIPGFTALIHGEEFSRFRKSRLSTKKSASHKIQEPVVRAKRAFISLSLQSAKFRVSPLRQWGLAS